MAYSNEWLNHPEATFMEVEISTGKTFFLTEEDVLNTWDLTKKDIDSMVSISKVKDGEIEDSVTGNSSWVLIKK